MSYLIVYAHPNPKSFNHAIKEGIVAALKAQGKEAVVRDLYQHAFAPVLCADDFVQFIAGKTPADIAAEQELVRKAETLIFVHPVWWFSIPAVLKGYIDRVFSRGFAYDFKGQRIIGLLKGKKVMIFSTTGGPRIAYFLLGYRRAIQKTVHQGIFAFCGMRVVLHRYFFAVPSVSQGARTRMLEEIKKISF